MNRFRRILRPVQKILVGFLFLLFPIIIGIALILTAPQPDSEAVSQPQPLLTASPGMEISQETDLATLGAGFPVPFMSFMSGSGMTFISASSGDAALEGGFGRILTSQWLTPDGNAVTLQSIYPADAFSLLDGDHFHFSSVSGPVLFGVNSVRMENDQWIRLHVQTESGLYTVTLPHSSGKQIPDLVHSLQLFMP